MSDIWKDKLKYYLDKIIQYAISRGDASSRSDYKLNNKYAKSIDLLFKEMQKDELLLQNVLALLIDNSNVYVRQLAATQAIKINYMKDKAINTLQEIAENKEYGMARIDAVMFLKYYEPGINQILKITNLTPDNNCTEIIIEHVEKYIGKIDSVLHENVSNDFQIDILHVKPSKHRDYHTFVTCGMSNKPMNVPKGAENYNYSELIITLPSDWFININNLQDENCWPVRCLLQLAKLPYEKNTWLGYGHTIQNKTPEMPYVKNTELCCMLLTYPRSVAEAINFTKLKIDNHKTVFFYALVPINKKEAEFKLKHGVDLLLEKFDQARINDVICLARKSVC